MNVMTFISIGAAYRLRLLWAVSVLCLWFAAAQVQAMDYYVNDGSTSNDVFCTAVGSDSNDGHYPGMPVASLQTILTRYTLGPSNTVYIDSGTYLLTNNIVIDARHAGSGDYPVVIKGVPRHTILMHQNSGAESACMVNHANHIDLTGLTFTGADVGLFINASSCGNARISENTFCNISGVGLEVKPGVYTTYGFFKILNNLFYDTANGMRLEGQINMDRGDQFLVCNNTVTVTNGYAVYMEGYFYSCEVYNNILVADGGGTCLETEGDYMYFTSDWNDLWATGSGTAAHVTTYGITYDLNRLADWQRFTQLFFYSTSDKHSFSHAPLFASPALHDFHLTSAVGRFSPTSGVWVADQSHSPCIDSAIPYCYTEDLDSEPAPNGGRKNMGIYGGTTEASKTAAGRMLLVLSPDRDTESESTSSQPIYWNATGTGWLSNNTVRLDYSLNDGESWTAIANGLSIELSPPADGEYGWDRPEETYTGNNGCLIRVAWENDNAIQSTVMLSTEAVIVPITTYYVNNSDLTGDIWCTAVGNIENDGLNPATPLPSIEEVINRYAPTFGDTIYVDSGIYVLSSTLVLPDSGPPNGEPGSEWFKLIGANRQTILIGNRTASGPGLYVEQDFTHIEGFVIRGFDTGIMIDPKSCRNARLLNNTFAANSGYGVTVLPDATNEGFDTYDIYNNLFYGNGGGMNLQASSGYHLAYFNVKNNTVAGYKGVGIACGGRAGGTLLLNNIVSVKGFSGRCLTINVADALGSSDYNNLYPYGGAKAVRWTDGSTIFTLADWQSKGFDTSSISADPLFVSAYVDNYHLRSTGGSWHYGQWTADTLTSPCVDAGNPSSDYAGEPDPNGSRVNMGAYGNTSQASRSVSTRIISLLNPRGGEIWNGVITVRWSATGDGWQTNDSVRIEYYSRETGWSVVTDATALSSTGSFEWSVPSPTTATASYYLRVVCEQDNTVFAITDSAGIVTRVSKTYYVNDSSSTNDVYCTAVGATNHTGDSTDSPMPSLNDVLTRFQLGPGDIVYVDTGTYMLLSNIVISSNHKGTQDVPIRIIGTGTGTLFIREPDGTDRRCVEVHADYVRIEGLTCEGADVGIAVNASTARHVQLVGNTCRSNTGYGIEVKPYYTTYSTGEEYQILQNVVVDNGAGIYLKSAYDAFTSEGRATFVVENNTVYNGGSGITILNANKIKRRTNLLKNNIIETTNSAAACIVTLPNSIHYSDFNNLKCAPEGYIGAWQSGPGTQTGYTTLTYWHFISGQDKNSISQSSRFINPTNGNFRLLSSSPCIDKGVISFWMFDAVDRDGFPRIAGKTADIGAYELNMTSSVRLFLEGPFQLGTDSMSTVLTTNHSLSLTSPYADDPRTAHVIPDNVTDWVLVQFRKTADGSAVLSRSTFLRSDGRLVNDDGTPGLDVDLPPNASYYVVIKHRNHLAAMSAEPVAFDGQSLSYNFSADSNAFYDGSNGCVAVSGATETLWALRAGDSDGDGKILTVDHSISLSQINAVGYWRGDADLDGIVTLTDNNLIFENLEHASAVPNSKTVLQPALRLIPSRRTLTVGESLTLWSGVSSSTADATTTIPPDGSGTTTPSIIIDDPDTLTTPGGGSNQWAFVENMSSASLIPEAFDTAVYTAGEFTGRTDVVESWDAYDRLGRAVFNVISTQSVASAGKVLIVAGRKSADDTLWPTTDYLADNAYNILRYRGFSKENIAYLNPEPDQDVDSNGILDDIDDESTFAAMENAFTNSLAGADRVFIYLVDHGGNSSGNGYFRLNEAETITAAQLGSWLDTLQNTYNMNVTVLLDFCYAGSFLKDLAYTGEAERIVVAACNDSQPSYFVAGGLVSFSGTFFSGVLLGYDVMQCFTLAQSAMSTYQAGQLDDDKNGSYTTNDSAVATGTYIGPTFTGDGDTPQIGEVCGNQVLSDETAATLWLGSVTALYPVSHAWCLIVPPGHNPDPDNPVTDLPQLDLHYDSESGRYSVTYDGFTADGTYLIQFYVQDEAGNLSAPRQSYVAQIGYDDRVILVAGGSTNDAAWPAIDYLTQLAYTTLRLRLFTPDHICLLSPDTMQDLDGDGTNDVTAATGTATLENAISQWAATNSTDRLTLYLIGEGEQNTFRLNETEALSTNQLASWVHTYQSTNPIPVNIILDFSGAGAFLPALADSTAADGDTEASRIVMASAHAGRGALLANGGTVSFSQYLLSGLIGGETLGDAYTDARRAIRRVSGRVRQRAQIDDNNNGIAGEKNIDGLLANETYLGSAFVTGADSPEIGDVIPPTVLDNPGTPLTLWAQNVAGMNAISNVWCVVTPPGFSETMNVPEMALTWNPGSDRYEHLYTDFVLPGTYMLTFYAQDILGEISDPVQSEVILADAFEPDDTSDQASLYHGEVQQHNFHTASDTDWIRFYMVTNFIYDFETYHFSESLDTILDFYRELPDGTLDLLDHVDEEASDLGEYTGIDFPPNGWYQIRVMPYAGNTNDAIGTYELSIEIPAGDGLTSLIVLGVDDVYASALPTNATATVTGEGTTPFNGSTSVVFSGLTNGTYLVSVPTPDDFIPREDPSVPYQVTSLTNIYYANPRLVTIDGGWRMAGFEMLSTLRIRSGEVRDAWTQAFLGNARISFTASSGSLTGVVVNGSVILTDYSTNWLSGANGQLPANIVIGACNWDFGVALTNYEPYARTGAVSNEATGTEVDLETAYLIPVDANSNYVADAWENAYFPCGMSATEDSDSDGLNNLHEYYCGTDPTDELSVLRFLSGPTDTGTASMVWSTVGGRSYQIMAVTSLVDLATMTTNGPWEASHDQESMEWTDPDASLYKTRFYRVRLGNP